MNEATRNLIVHRSSQGATKCQIAREAGVSPRTVGRVLAGVAQQRRPAAASAAPGASPRGRPSRLDPFVPVMKDLLARYPNLTVVRMLEELRARDFGGGYTIVRQTMKQLRPRPVRPPVERFETTPGAQAQMDYAVYDLDFSDEGRRRVNLFGYTLGYSRRQYLRFVPAQDFETTVREHLRAFAHLGGVAAVCLYDNMKVVVSGHDGDVPLYNPRFLAFATHYGFRPWACRRRRPRTKGKIERQFHYVEVSLLNGRTFRSLEHLNEVTAWWLANVADVRIHRETRRRPLDLHAEELPHLLPLPARPYDADPVVYRHVNAEGFIAYQQNWYSAPWRYIGAIVPVRVAESELVIYSPKLQEIARHRRLDRSVVGQRCQEPSHRPSDDRREQLQTLRQRYAELGPAASRFFEQLLQAHRCGKDQAKRILALLASYHLSDVLAALERASRYGAFSHATVERILAVQAKPKSLLEMLADEGREHLEPLLTAESIPPRPTSEYQSLLVEEPDADGQHFQADDQRSQVDDQDAPRPA